MARTVKAIIMMVAFCCLALLVLTPAPLVDHGAGHQADHHAAAVDQPVVEPAAAPTIPAGYLADQGPAAARACYSSPDPVAWPSVAFSDRNRPRRGTATGDARPDLHQLDAASSPVRPVAPAPALAAIDRLVDLRALSDPRVLRVIRS